MKERNAEKLQKFTDAYNSFFTLIYKSVYSKVNDEDQCDDICQEVFMRFFSKIDEVVNPRAWLFGTMRIVVIDYYKRKGKSDSDIESIMEDASMSYVNGFRETRLIIEEALNHPDTFTSEDERILFDLIAVSNFTYADAAAHLGITYRKARYAFEKTSKKVVEYLKNKGISALEELL